MSVNSKKKGNMWENRLAGWLHSHGIKAWKDGASGGGSREKGDVGNNIDMTIESKACKKPLLEKWWAQTQASASKHHNSPVLFIHIDGMPDLEWMVVMHSEDWVEMTKLAKQTPNIVEVPAENDRERRWALDQLKSAINRAMKFL